MIRRMLPRTLFVLLALCAFLPSFAGKGGRQNPDVEKISDKGKIDWKEGVLYATGLGVIPNDEPNQAKAYLKARTFAKLDALRNLLMVVDHVKIDSQTTGADFESKSDEIRAEVRGIVRGAQITAEREIPFKNGHMVEVTVASAMYGDSGVASVFLHPPLAKPGSGDNTEPPAPAIAPKVQILRKGTPDGYRITEPGMGRPFTGLIVDVRGFGVERAMSPKIRRADGSELWGSVSVDPDYVVEHGIVSYAHSLEEARKLTRAGDHPLVLQGIGRAGGAFLCDAVLSDADAAFLMQVAQRDGFLDKFHVIFVIDSRN